MASLPPLEDDLPPAQGSEALVLMALTAMVLIALAAFWAIGTKAYIVWEFHDPLFANASSDQPVQTTPVRQ